MSATLLLTDKQAAVEKPKKNRRAHWVLEIDGPRGESFVAYSPRTNLPPMSFEEWKALPDHVRNTRDKAPWDIDADIATRIGRLLAKGYKDKNFSKEHILEILARFEILHPGTIEDIREITWP